VNSTLFLIVRAAHAIWIGSHIFSTFMLMPAIDESGPSGGQVMMRINARGIVAYMFSVALLTLASGLVLFWRFTGGFDPAVAATHAGMAFGFGGTAGILAGAVGGGVIGRNAKRVVAIAGRLASLPDGAEKTSLVWQAAALRRRMKLGSQLVTVLQVVAVVLMALGTTSKAPPPSSGASSGPARTRRTPRGRYRGRAPRVCRHSARCTDSSDTGTSAHARGDSVRAAAVRAVSET